ncbi:thioesterase domain-containing protein [Streptomyces sp. M19]
MLRGLTARLGRDQPVYGLQARGLTSDEPLPRTLWEQAADYAERIREVSPHGPYRLLGWSVGGILAHSVAVLLQEAGAEVELLALLDAFPAEQWRERPAPEEGDALTAVLRMAGFERAEERTRTTYWPRCAGRAARWRADGPHAGEDRRHRAEPRADDARAPAPGLRGRSAVLHRRRAARRGLADP